MFYYWTLAPGGVQHMMAKLAGELLKRGHHVTFVIAIPAAGTNIRLPAGSDLVHLGVTRSAAATVALARHIRRLRPDVIYTGMPTMNITAVLANRLAGRPSKVVISERSNPALEFAHAPTWRYRMASRLQPAVYKMADAIVAVSRELADDLASYSGLDREKIQVIYNPAWSQRTSSVVPPHPWLEKSKPPVVITAGRLVPQKDFEFFLEAFARLRQRVFVRGMLLGEGPLMNDLVARANQLGIAQDVAFIGHVDDVVPWFEHSRVFALTSRWEGFGNVLVQALGAGCGIVSTRCRSGPAEILSDGEYGRLVDVGDTEAFVSALSEMIAHPPDPYMLRERASAFSVERSADRYEALFNRLVGN